MKTNPCYCGHDCARCLTYLATVRSDARMREKSRTFYRETFGTELPPEKIHCRGGRSEDVFCLCGGCPFRNCCRERGLDACAECAEYPCAMLADYRKTYVNQCNQIKELTENGGNYETADDDSPDGNDG